MYKTIKTTGGDIHPKEIEFIINSICDVFECAPSEITNLQPLQKGISNSVITFNYIGNKYVFRYPGAGLDKIIDRDREAISQMLVKEAELDPTFVSMSTRYGWRISRFVETRTFNYHNAEDMERGVTLIRDLHKIQPKVRCEFDIKEQWEAIIAMIPKERFARYVAAFPNYSEVKERVGILYELSKIDGITKCLTHGDCRDDNFLINDEIIYLIDWEYSGFGDPGIDIGTFVCGGYHTEEDIVDILSTYFGRKPNYKEIRHYWSYIAISGFFFLHNALYYVSCRGGDNKRLFDLTNQWYHYAKYYSEKSLPLYKDNSID